MVLGGIWQFSADMPRSLHFFCRGIGKGCLILHLPVLIANEFFQAHFRVFVAS